MLLGPAYVRMSVHIKGEPAGQGVTPPDQLDSVSLCRRTGGQCWAHRAAIVSPVCDLLHSKCATSSWRSSAIKLRLVLCAGRVFAEHLLRLASRRLLQQREAHRSAYVNLYPNQCQRLVQILRVYVYP